MFLSFLPDNFLYTQTFGYALNNISKRLNLEYNPIWYTKSEQLTDVASQEAKFVLLDFNPFYDPQDLRNLKKKCPNAKLIVFSADTIYSGEGADKWATWEPDLWLDTIESVVLNTTLFPCKQLFWTISESVINEIQSLSHELNFEKTNFFLTMCRCAQPERFLFFHELEIRNKRVRHTLNLWEPKLIYQSYAESWFSLGISSPVWAGKPRSMKGYRDWIAPFCDTVLIYDDYPDVQKYWPCPIYKFQDYKDCIRITTDLITNPKEYQRWIEIQKQWGYNNTIEKQLERILMEIKWLNR